MKNKSAVFISLAVVVAVVAVIIILFGNSGNTNISGGNVNNPDNSGSQSQSGGENPRSIKEFSLVANDFEFTPGTLTVNEGDTVILHITSEDVEHGIAIPEFGVSKTIPAGETVDVEFVADKKGTYTFFCNVYCGSGHRDMTGILIVN